MFTFGFFLQSWGGKEHGYGLADCCSMNMKLPTSASTFYYEYYDSEGVLQCIDPQLLQQFSNAKSPGEIAHQLCRGIHVQLDDDQKVTPNSNRIDYTF